MAAGHATEARKLGSRAVQATACCAAPGAGGDRAGQGCRAQGAGRIKGGAGQARWAHLGLIQVVGQPANEHTVLRVGAAQVLLQQGRVCGWARIEMCVAGGVEWQVERDGAAAARRQHRPAPQASSNIPAPAAAAPRRQPRSVQDSKQAHQVLHLSLRHAWRQRQGGSGDLIPWCRHHLSQ